MENDQPSETGQEPRTDEVVAAPSQTPNPTGFYSTAGFGNNPPFDPPPPFGNSQDADEGAAHSADQGAHSADHGADFDDAAGFIPPPPVMAPEIPRRLYRTEGPISGVSAGLAEYFNIDAVLVRLLIVAGSIVSFPVVPFAYVAAWMIIPKKTPTPVAPLMTPPAPVDSPVDCLTGK